MVSGREYEPLSPHAILLGELPVAVLLLLWPGLAERFPMSPQRPPRSNTRLRTSHSHLRHFRPNYERARVNPFPTLAVRRTARIWPPTAPPCNVHISAAFLIQELPLGRAES